MFKELRPLKRIMLVFILGLLVTIFGFVVVLAAINNYINIYFLFAGGGLMVIIGPLIIIAGFVPIIFRNPTSVELKNTNMHDFSTLHIRPARFLLVWIIISVISYFSAKYIFKSTSEHLQVQIFAGLFLIVWFGMPHMIFYKAKQNGLK